MMAPYAIGHLKMGLIFDELGYKMADDERFKLYLTNTLEMEEIEQIAIPVEFFKRRKSSGGQSEKRTAGVGDSGESTLQWHFS